MDTAQKSLSEALRLSFRLLSFFMIFVLVLFFFTGLSQVQTNERGIKLLFGRIQGKQGRQILNEGLAWSLPEPIGRVETIPTDERRVAINDFWFHETPEEAAKKLSERRVSAEGLRPGWDGALLTGDRALVHMKLTCAYRIGFRGNKPDDGAIIDNRSNVIDADDVVRSAVCNAAIRVAATLTVDSILTSAKMAGDKATGVKEKSVEDAFALAVKKIGQARLDKMKSGIWIVAVKVDNRTPPLAARAAFDDVGKARQEEDTFKSDAISEAREILQQAAGDSWKVLVDNPAGAARSDKIPLLKKYALAREDNNKVAAEKLLDEINMVLVSDETTGDADALIEEAKRYNDSIRRRVESRAKRFNELIDKYRAKPKLMTSRLWLDVEEEIFNSPGIVKHFLTPGKKFILKINQDQEIVRKNRWRKFQTKTGEKKGAKKNRRPSEPR